MMAEEQAVEQDRSMARLAEMLTQHGIKVIGYDEGVEPSVIPPTVFIDGEDSNGIKAVELVWNQGYRSITVGMAFRNNIHQLYLSFRYSVIRSTV